MVRDLETSGHDLTEVPSWHLVGETEKLSLNINSNQVPQDYKRRKLPAKKYPWDIHVKFLKFLMQAKGKIKALKFVLKSVSPPPPPFTSRNIHAHVGTFVE
jgi:hypothetical protein